MQLRSEQFSLATLSFKAPVQWANSSFRAADVQISGQKLLVRQKSQTPISAEELRINGTWEANARESMKAAGQIRINQGRFASRDGTRVGENLTVGGRFEISSRQDTKETSIAGKLDIDQGEMLWGKFYGDLKSQRPSLQFDGDYVPGADVLRMRQLNLALATVGRVAARGDIEQASQIPVLRLEIKSDDIQPAGFFEFFIRHTLNRSFPLLDQLAVGGRLGFAVKTQGTLDNLSVEGAIQLRGGEVQNKSKNWQVGPLQLELPFRIQYPAAGLPPTPSNMPTGTLTIESARFGAEAMPATKTAVSLWNNALRFHQPIRLPIYGGFLENFRPGIQGFYRRSPGGLAFAGDEESAIAETHGSVGLVSVRRHAVRFYTQDRMGRRFFAQPRSDSSGRVWWTRADQQAGGGEPIFFCSVGQVGCTVSRY